jgi:hypothetical protein
MDEQASKDFLLENNVSSVAIVPTRPPSIVADIPQNWCGYPATVGLRGMSGDAEHQWLAICVVPTTICHPSHGVMEGEVVGYCMRLVQMSAAGAGGLASR